jgi:hypothetical protein
MELFYRATMLSIDTFVLKHILYGHCFLHAFFMLTHSIRAEHIVKTQVSTRMDNLEQALGFQVSTASPTSCIHESLKTFRIPL